jgi:Fe-S-cluster containining protein
MSEVRSREPRFACTLCGDCCTGAQVVRLARHDLTLLVRRLNLNSVKDLKTRGVVRLVRESLGQGRSVWRPRLHFRSRPLVQCPFLVNDVDDAGRYRGLCSLHPDAKPLVCALSPLAREVEDSGQGPVTETWTFVPPVEGCPGVGRGELLPLEAPAGLRSRLAEEVADLRLWSAESSSCPDEESAWDLLASRLDFRIASEPATGKPVLRLPAGGRRPSVPRPFRPWPKRPW